MRIRFPPDFVILSQNRKPGEPMVGADLVVGESILPIAPCAENHPLPRIGIDHTMSPSWRNDYLVPNCRRDREALAGIVGRKLLCVHDGASFPNLE